MFHKNESTLTAIIQLSKLELSSDYLNKKFNDYRLYTAAILLTLIPLGLAEGIFDYKSHPEIRCLLMSPSVSTPKTIKLESTTITNPRVLAFIFTRVS